MAVVLCGAFIRAYVFVINCNPSLGSSSTQTSEVRKKLKGRHDEVMPTSSTPHSSRGEEMYVGQLMFVTFYDKNG